MSNNFYWGTIVEPVYITEEEKEILRRHPNLMARPQETHTRYGHIGRENAAGAFCWDCMQTLKPGGVGALNTSGCMLDHCPRCLKPMPLPLPPLDGKTRPTGIRAACSFSFAENSEEVFGKCQRHLNYTCIIDEYGRGYTGQQFLDRFQYSIPPMLVFTHSVGENFS